MSTTLRVRKGVTALLASACYGAGWIMAFSDAEAQQALASGEWEPAPAPKEKKSTAAVKPDGEDLVAAIIEAIGGLGEKDFGKDGTPMVKPIEDILGYGITAAERDTTWDTIQAAHATS